MSRLKICIVTPSFNQVQFIEDTILSVIGQNYSSLEYIVMDGGSTDGTAEILKKYSDAFFHWQSQPDQGQASAINEGFNKTGADILAWINSDDYYLPGIFQYISELMAVDQAQVLVGNCFHFVENGSRVFGSSVVDNFKTDDLTIGDFIIQPATFWTRKAWELVGPLNPDYKYVFDWDWFIRAKQAKVKFIPVNRYLAAYRLHDDHKTGSGGEPRISEILEIYKKYNTDVFHSASEYLKKKKSIKKISRWLSKAHLTRLDWIVKQIVFPDIYRGMTFRESQYMKYMLESDL